MKKIFTLVLIVVATNQIFAQPCIPNTNSILFDGSSSYISISPQNGLDLTAAVTVEAWIYPTLFGFTSAQNSIVCKHGWSSGEAGYVLRTGGTGELSFNIGGVDTNGINVSWKEVISSTGIMTLNTWYHVAGTYDGTELKCYVNGNLEGTTPFIGSIATSPNYPLAIGRLADPVYGPDRYFGGSIDEVRIWNRALSQAEIQSGMNNHIDPIGANGLVSYWRMNEGVNSTVYDVAGINNGGTVFTTWSPNVPFNAVPPTPIITYNNGILSSSATTGNQWYMGGNQIAGETQNTFTPLQNGVYEVEVTSAQGCSTMSAQFTVIDVSTHDLTGAISATVFPNPFSDVAMIEFVSSENISDAILSITDVQGRKLDELNNIVLHTGTKKISLNRKNLSSGIYFFEVRNENEIITKGKLMVE